MSALINCGRNGSILTELPFTKLRTNEICVRSMVLTDIQWYTMIIGHTIYVSCKDTRNTSKSNQSLPSFKSVMNRSHGTRNFNQYTASHQSRECSLETKKEQQTCLFSSCLYHVGHSEEYFLRHKILEISTG